MRRLFLLLIAFVSAVFPWLKSYEVQPVKAAWSGKVSGDEDYGVGQVITCNFDSICYCELFVGYLGQNSQNKFRAEVWEVNGPLVARKYDVNPPDHDHKWLRFNLEPVPGQKFMRGKQYLVKFTRPGDSIQFYYDMRDPYPYGEIPDDIVPNPADLACRIYGVMKPVPDSFWGGFAKLPLWLGHGVPNRRRAWDDSLRKTDIGWMPFDIQWQEAESLSLNWNFYDIDAHIGHIAESVGAKPVAIFTRTPKWASTRVDSHRVVNTDGGETWVYDTSVYCAPRNLWVQGDDNYWVRFLEAVITHHDRYESLNGGRIWRPADSIHTWIIWNEPNDTCILNLTNITGWWRRPNIAYLEGFDGLRGLVTLYMRMAWLAHQVITQSPGHADDRILVGAVHRDTWRNPLFLVSGVDWVDMCYRVTEDSGWGIFWDGVAVHPYQEQHFGFSPEELEFSAETLRAVMRHYEDYGGELWDTEMGWNRRHEGLPDSTDARNLGESYVTALASQALLGAGGGYDRLAWWLPYWPDTASWNWLWLRDNPLDSTSLVPQKGYYAFKQACSTLTGKRFNQRVLLGDVRDDSVRIYEFEEPLTHKRTWVAWKNQTTTEGNEPPVAVRIPVRSDTLTYVGLDYDGNPPTGTKVAKTDGWLDMNLAVRPVFLAEQSDTARPDLRVDSVWVVLNPVPV
ncbi:MAG: hypothetical protein ABIK44_03735, partial [candidate division WOR-3 bacterium]